MKIRNKKEKIINEACASEQVKTSFYYFIFHIFYLTTIVVTRGCRAICPKGAELRENFIIAERFWESLPERVKAP